MTTNGSPLQLPRGGGKDDSFLILESKRLVHDLKQLYRLHEGRGGERVRPALCTHLT